MKRTEVGAPYKPSVVHEGGGDNTSFHHPMQWSCTRTHTRTASHCLLVFASRGGVAHAIWACSAVACNKSLYGWLLITVQDCSITEWSPTDSCRGEAGHCLLVVFAFGWLSFRVVTGVIQVIRMTCLPPVDKGLQAFVRLPHTSRVIHS